jgi:hypothetical protein
MWNVFRVHLDKVRVQKNENGDNSKDNNLLHQMLLLALLLQNQKMKS